MPDIEDLSKKLKEAFDAKTSFKENVLYVEVAADKYLEVAKFLNGKFDRLLTVSAVDFIKEGFFEVYFTLYRFDSKVYCKVSTRIPREEAKIESLSELWPNAAMHEREAWEMFGIEFRGNPMLKPLFTEEWTGPPPFRKDFNWRKYVAEVYRIPQAMR